MSFCKFICSTLQIEDIWVTVQVPMMVPMKYWMSSPKANQHTHNNLNDKLGGSTSITIVYLKSKHYTEFTYPPRRNICAKTINSANQALASSST